MTRDCRLVLVVLVMIVALCLPGCASIEARISSHTVGETRLIYAAAVASDALSTGAARNNGWELNPVYRDANQRHLTQWVALSGLVVFPVCDGLVRLIWPNNDNAVKGCYAGASLPRFGAAAWNTYQFTRPKRPVSN